MVIYLSVFLLSASALAYEIVLSRLFSIAQFYHFAFMTVSLALLGAGASGTALAVSPRLRRGNPARRLSAFGWRRRLPQWQAGRWRTGCRLIHLQSLGIAARLFILF